MKPLDDDMGIALGLLNFERRLGLRLIREFVKWFFSMSIVLREPMP